MIPSTALQRKSRYRGLCRLIRRGNLLYFLAAPECDMGVTDIVDSSSTADREAHQSDCGEKFCHRPESSDTWSMDRSRLSKIGRSPVGFGKE